MNGYLITKVEPDGTITPVRIWMTKSGIAATLSEGSGTFRIHKVEDGVPSKTYETKEGRA